MNPFLAHLGSGGSFYTGTLIVVAGLGVEKWTSGYWARQGGRLLVIGGTGAVAASSVPQPWWLLAIWATTFLTWRLNENGRWGRSLLSLDRARILFLAVTALVVAAEVPYAMSPQPLRSSPERILVVGDSLTAGTFRLHRSQRWPSVFEHRYDVEVTSIARPGWKVSQAARRLKTREWSKSFDAAVLVIGGNDVLLDTRIGRFRKGLRSILKTIERLGIPVYMVEIPLSPTGYFYGRVQRKLAEKYRIRLIPKHELTDVMTGANRTLDGIHLSTRGHQHMARMIHNALSPE